MVRCVKLHITLDRLLHVQNAHSMLCSGLQQEITSVVIVFPVTLFDVQIHFPLTE